MIRAERNGVAAEVRKMYAERGGVAAAVVKVYAEKNGVAELVFPVGIGKKVLSKSTATADDLSLARCYIGTGCTANHAFFVGGADSSNNGCKNVDAYDINGVMTAAADISLAQARATCVQNGDSANPILLVARGPETGSSATASSYVYYYSDDLTRSGASNLNTAVMQPAAFYLNGKSIIAGGRNGSSYYGFCNCYTKNHTRTLLDGLSKGRAYSGGAATDDFGAIIGGYDGTRLTDIDYYNKSDVHSVGRLSTGRQYPMTARLGDGIVVAGGNIALNGSTSATDSIEYISKDKVISTIGTLHHAVSIGNCAGNDEIVAFFDGADGSTAVNVRTKDVEYMNSDMVATLTDPTTDEHFLGGAARLGNRVFIGGGAGTGGARVSSVEIYEIKEEQS